LKIPLNLNIVYARRSLPDRDSCPLGRRQVVITARRYMDIHITRSIDQLFPARPDAGTQSEQRRGADHNQSL